MAHINKGLFLAQVTFLSLVSRVSAPHSVQCGSQPDSVASLWGMARFMEEGMEPSEPHAGSQTSVCKWQTSLLLAFNGPTKATWLSLMSQRVIFSPAGKDTTERETVIFGRIIISSLKIHKDTFLNFCLDRHPVIFKR